MQALKGTYDIDKKQFKDVIGSLNWIKFSERIQAQLQSNSLLTHQQREIMEVNSIVALILSHQFDKARTELTRIMSTSGNKHPALRGIQVYFILKDKKYDEALKLLDGAKDINLVFLRSQVLLSAKRPKEAFENLALNFEKDLITNSGYIKLLLRSALAFECPLDSAMSTIMQVAQERVTDMDSSAVILLADYLEQQNEPKTSMGLLEKAYYSNRGDIALQSRYLMSLSVQDFDKAWTLQQGLEPLEFDEDENMNEADII